MPAGRQLIMHEDQVVLAYTTSDDPNDMSSVQFITRAMFTQLAGNIGCPPLCKLVKRGSKWNLIMHHLWIDPDGKMRWRIGELINGSKWETIAWKLYEQVPARKIKGQGMMKNAYDQGCFEGSKRWVDALEQTGYTLLFPEDEEIANQLYALRSQSPEMLTGNIKIPKCMLAEKFRADRLDPQAVIIDYKIDGVRYVSTIKNGQVVMATRKRKVKGFEYLQGIRSQLKVVFAVLGEITGTDSTTSQYWLDGELYRHGWSFQKIMTAVSKSVNHATDEKEIVYVVYDIVDDGSATQLLRRNALDKVFRDSRVKQLKNIKLIKYSILLNGQYDDITKLHQQAEREGYEGLIVRNIKGFYPVKELNGLKERSNDLMKVKKFITTEGWIVGAIAATGTHQGCVTWVVSNRPDGKGLRYNADPAGEGIGDLETRRRQMQCANLYIGTVVTVKYFEATDDGIPRFPKVIAYRRNDLPGVSANYSCSQ